MNWKREPTKSRKEPEFVTPTARMNLYAECVKTETKKPLKVGEYSINPFSMQNITEKPNHVTPKQPFRTTKSDDLIDDRVDRAFRLDAMRRKIVTAGLQPR